MADTDQGMRSFVAWSELLDYIGRGEPVYYQAPMDPRARRIDVKILRRKRVPSLVRVSPFGYWPRGSRPFDPFTADAGHLDRFRRPTSDQWGRNRAGVKATRAKGIHRPDVRAVERAFGLQEGETYDYEDEATSNVVKRISGHSVHFTTNENTGYITAWVKGAGNIASGYLMKEVEEKASRKLQESGVSAEIRAWLRDPRNQPRPTTNRAGDLGK